MSITGAQLITKIAVEGADEAAGKVKNYGQVVDETGAKSEKGGSAIGGMFKQALSFAAGQAIFAGLGFLKDQIGGIFTESMNAQQGMAETVTVLQHMGSASGQTAQSVADFATQMSHLTKFSDDTVQHAENVMLTFGNIGKNIFPQATTAAMNMSAMLGTDLQSSVIQVGKALNDPIQGLTALSRVGVSFREDEKKSIQTMMAHNDIAGAQGIIMSELNKQFGGAAIAAGKTFGGQLAIAQQRLDDMKQAIGDRLMPILAQFLGFIENTVVPGIGAGFTAASNALKPFGDTLTQIGQIFKSVFGGMGGTNPLTSFISSLASQALPILQRVGQAFYDFNITLQKNLSTINPQQIIGFFKSIGDYAMPVLKQVGDIVGGQLKQDFATFTGIVQNLAGWWQSSMVPAIQQAMPGFMALGNVLFTQVVPALARLWAAGHQIVDALMPVFIKVFETVEPILVRVGGFISGLLAKAIQYLLPYIMQATAAIVQFAQEIATRAMPFITQVGTLISTVLGFIMAHWSQIWGVLGPIVTGVFNIIIGIIKVAWSLISGIFKIALDLISGNWRGAWTDMKNMIGGVFDGIGTIIHGALGALLGMLGGFFGGLANQALTWGWNIIQNLASGIINGIWSALGNAMSAVGNFISSHLPSSPAKRGPLRDLALQGSRIPEQIAQGMVAGVPKLQSSLNLMLTPSASLAAPSRASGIGAFSPQIIVQPPDIYLDGHRLTQAQMPYIANAIRNVTNGRGF